MKKRKRLVLFLLCGCCLFPFAAAEGISIGEELVQAEEQEHLDEFSEMREILNAQRQTDGVQAYAMNTDNELDPSQAYPVYRLSGTDILSDYETAGSIESLLTEERVWMITPTAQSVTSLYKTEEGWSSPASVSSVDGDPIRNRIDKAVLAAVLDEAGIFTGEEELRYIISYRYYTVFAYLKANGTEYLVPFASRPEFIGLENGKVYTAPGGDGSHAEPYPSSAL